MDHAGECLEDKNAEKNAMVYFKGQQDATENWARSHSCCALAKNLTALCLCPVNLSEHEYKSNYFVCVMIYLAEQFSRQDSTQTIAAECLLLTVLNQIYKEQIERYEKCKVWEEKRWGAYLRMWTKWYVQKAHKC